MEKSFTFPLLWFHTLPCAKSAKQTIYCMSAINFNFFSFSTMEKPFYFSPVVVSHSNPILEYKTMPLLLDYCR